MLEVCLGVVMSETDTTPKLMVTLDYVFSQIFIGVDVCLTVSGVCVCVRVS